MFWHLLFSALLGKINANSVYIVSSALGFPANAYSLFENFFQCNKMD